MHTSTSWRTCQCDDCRARMRAYNREYMRAFRSTPGPRLVDATETRARLHALCAAGWTLRALAQHVGYDHSTLASVSCGRTKRVRTVMAEDLLSVPLEVAA